MKHQTPEAGLSVQDQNRVREYLPLVEITLRRMGAITRNSPDHLDLFQEGCLALSDAVRNHDPNRHGVFGAYAMARVHHAVGKYLHENVQLLRIPYIEQRRHRQRTASGATPDRKNPLNSTRGHNPDSSGRGGSNDDFPRIRARGDLALDRPRGNMRTLRTSGFERGRTLGEWLRRRLDRARQRAVAKLIDDVGPVVRAHGVILACQSQRWSVPDPAQQTPLRVLAVQCRCTASQISRYEKRFRLSVVEHLKVDRVFHGLLRMAQIHPAGWQHVFDMDDVNDLRSGIRRVDKKNAVPDVGARRLKFNESVRDLSSAANQRQTGESQQ